MDGRPRGEKTRSRLARRISAEIKKPFWSAVCATPRKSRDVDLGGIASARAGQVRNKDAVADYDSVERRGGSRLQQGGGPSPRLTVRADKRVESTADKEVQLVAPQQQAQGLPAVGQGNGRTPRPRAVVTPRIERLHTSRRVVDARP